MDSNIFDYIILALIFIVVIHVFVQTFGSKCTCKEYMKTGVTNQPVDHNKQWNRQQSFFDSIRKEMNCRAISFVR
jgi:hypothetical protein